MRGRLSYSVAMNTEERHEQNALVVATWLKKGEPLKLELGAGPFKRPGWISLDLEEADLLVPLGEEPLPFPDNSVAYIYSSHVFEHFTFPDPMLPILTDCMRALQPRGVFDICVPNARPYIEAYCSGKTEYPYPAGLLHTPAYETHTNGRIDLLNYIAYMGGIHKYMFDEENLANLLRRAGFKGVHLREFRHGFDISGREHESIYAMGVKPE
ncbi:MAG: hypothetical protein DELT_02007 [Desulfovibrio sp.]